MAIEHVAATKSTVTQNGVVDLMPITDISPVNLARAIHFGKPGLMQALLGCAGCPLHNQAAGNQIDLISPRLKTDIDALRISCEGSSNAHSPCKQIADGKSQTLVIPEPEKIEHRMRRAIVKVDESCQMNCIYCANRDGATKKGAITIPSLYDILNLFHPKEVELTGGEPAFNFDLLLQSAKTAKQFTDFIMMNSNMELLNPERLKILEKAGLSHLHFALHAMDPEVHKIVRGKQKADIDKVLGVIKAALQHTNLKLIVEYIPMNFNLDEYPKVYEYVRQLRQEYGERIEELEIGRLIPVGRAQDNPIIPNMDEVIAKLASIGKPEFPVEVFCFGPATKRLVQLGYKEYECDAGQGMYYFELNGRVLADNFSGVEVAHNYRGFEPEKFKGIQCAFRSNCRK